MHAQRRTCRTRHRFRSSVRRASGVDAQIAAQIGAARFETKAGQRAHANYDETSGERLAARNSEARSGSGARRDEEFVNLRSIWIRWIFHSHFQRGAAEEILDSQMGILGNIALNFRRARGRRGRFAAVEFAIIRAPFRRIAQDFVRRVQLLRTPYRIRRIVIEVGVMLLAKQPVCAADLRGGAFAVEAQSGVMIGFSSVQFPDAIAQNISTNRSPFPFSFFRKFLRLRMKSFAPTLIALFAASQILRAAEAPDFNREVRPILSNYCFKCHGPDDKARKSKLRLDVREEALKPSKSGDHAIVPGKVEESELVTRIFSNDEDEVMPPPATKKELTLAQRDVLKRWVAAGAKYDTHWAFIAPRQAAVPQIRNLQSAIRNPIDAFVFSKLESEGLAPSPEADPITLCRRLYLDLTGVPPTPEEADAFVESATRNPQSAIESLADLLLSSPKYGERWARRWLDLARYADTNGYEKDRNRSIWPWRDWVIRALNADMPFDQFTIEQLAGDLLPNATPDQIVATGFHRNTMLNEEGGIDPLEFRFHAMTDRVATTGVTWLGLTVGCAQCHTHKFDPIQHREYYSMMAFLNNADEPDYDLPAPDAAARENANAEKLAKLLAELPGKWPAGESVDAKFAGWLARERGRTVAWTVLRPAEAKSTMPLLTVQPDGSIFGSGDITKADTYELKFANVPRGVTAVRLEALPDDRLPNHGPGMTFYEGPKGDFFMGEFQMGADGQAVKFGKATETFAKNSMGGAPATAALAIDGDPQTGWSASGREGQESDAVFRLAAPLGEARDLSLKMMFGRHYACSLGRFRISVTTDPRDTAAREIPDEIERLLTIDDAKLSADQRGKLREHFLLTAPELAAARAEIDNLRKPSASATTLVLRERPPENPRATFIHNRGEFLQPTDRVEPGVFAFLPPLPQGAKPDRLAFARWLVSPENPLTARVTVNRQWAILFGRGLVRTTEDFGYQGEPPSHPELLDWLAVEFVKQGWSLKKLHRLIVTSATYRQSSRVTPELLVNDAENKRLARGPRGRMDAEMIRDATLRAAGLLSEKIGGPSVHPPQQEGVSEVAYGSPKWTASTGEDRYRRGLYTFAKRTAPYAMLTTFDAPTGEACIARRDVSNSPLQALTLLNDVVFVEAAQALGKTFASQPGSVAERIVSLFRRVLTRPPAADETALLAKFFAAQKARFVSNELDAKAVAGEAPGDANERAAWTALARAIFNLDESVTKG